MRSVSLASEFSDCIQMFATLGEHERVAALAQFGRGVGGDPPCAGRVGGNRAEDLLDARIDGEPCGVELAVSSDQHPSGRGLDLLGVL